MSKLPLCAGQETMLPRKVDENQLRFREGEGHGAPPPGLWRDPAPPWHIAPVHDAIPISVFTLEESLPDI